MTKQLNNSIIRIFMDIDDVIITPEAEELILEAVKKYVDKLTEESIRRAFIMNRKTLRKEDVEYVSERIKRLNLSSF